VPKAPKKGTPDKTFDLTELLERLSLDHGLRVDFAETNYEYDREGFQNKLSDWSSRLPVWKSKLAAAELFRELNDTKQALAIVQSVEKQASTGPLRALLESKELHASILWEAQPNSRHALTIASSVIDVLEALPQARYRTLLLDAYDSAAIALYRMGRLDEAYAICERGLNLKPSNPYLRNTLGVILFDMNRFDEAVQEFDRVIRVARRRGRYSLLMDALNLKSLALPEAAKRDHSSMKVRVDKQAECEETRLELERIARIARSTFYLGCALINSAADLHIKGNILAAMDKATEAFELDRKTNPEDPDVSVTCEIMARILIDVAVIWCEGQEFQNIVQDGERIIAIGLRLAKETAEERACLYALRAVYLAEIGHYAEARKIMDRSLSYSIRYKKRDNLGWAYLNKARILALQNQWEGAARSLNSCGEYVKDNPIKELYYNCQKLIHLQWTQRPLAYTEIPLVEVRQLATYLDSQSTLRACNLVAAQRGANGQDANTPWNRTDILRAVYGTLDENHLKELLSHIRDTYHSWEV
jgi:tetratricopeptide (TPR) repeat protein